MAEIVVKKMLVDSHCHLNLLNLEDYQNDVGHLLEEAKKEGVDTILCVGVDLETAADVLNIASRFDQVWASVGLHPSHKTSCEPTEEDYIQLASHPRVVALGEMGLDYYYNHENLEDMRQRFRIQIRAARKLKKPIIIHSRDAPEDTIAILKEEKASEIGGVMHCFTESFEMAEAAMDLGFYISFSGIITFNKATNVVEVAKKIPLERLLIETDAPYLAPVPFRGKQNLPHYVHYVAERIAAIKSISFEEVVLHTRKNFFNLFKGAQSHETFS